MIQFGNFISWSFSRDKRDAKSAPKTVVALGTQKSYDQIQREEYIKLCDLEKRKLELSRLPQQLGEQAQVPFNLEQQQRLPPDTMQREQMIAFKHLPPLSKIISVDESEGPMEISQNGNKTVDYSKDRLGLLNRLSTQTSSSQGDYHLMGDLDLSKR